MLYSDESEWWIPESKEFCLICLRVGGGDLSTMSMMRHEQGKDSGPLELWTLLFACELPAPLPPTKTRCHKLLDVCGKWNPRVRVAEDPGVKDSVIFFFCRSALCDLSKLPLVEALRLTKSSATRFSWIRSKVLKGKYSKASLSAHLVECAFVECALVFIYHNSLSAHWFSLSAHFHWNFSRKTFFQTMMPL